MVHIEMVLEARQATNHLGHLECQLTRDLDSFCASLDPWKRREIRCLEPHQCFTCEVSSPEPTQLLSTNLVLFLPR